MFGMEEWGEVRSRRRRKLRDELARTAPITYQDVEGDLILLAKLKYAYADAMVIARKAKSAE